MGTYVTEEGFIPKRQDEIKTSLQNLWISVYGNDVQLSEESTNGQQIGGLSEALADVWDMAGEVYGAFLVGQVVGRVQELLYELNGMTRNKANESTVILTITGTPLITVSAGFQASTESGLTFETSDDIDIEVGGTVSIQGTATITGANEALAGTVTKIVTVVPGVDEVTNLVDTEPGTSKEQDPLFRLRQTLSTGTPGQNMLESLFGQLSDLDGVIAVRVYQNRTSVIDANGLDPNSFMPVVKGGDDSAIADITWINTPGGIGSVGNTTINIIDGQGFGQAVKFERPPDVDIFVDITLTKDADYPADGDEVIRQTIVDYTLGILLEETGFAGFGIGEDVLISRIYTPINRVQGHEITLLEIGLSFGALSGGNVAIDFNDISSFSISNVRINGATV